MSSKLRIPESYKNLKEISGIIEHPEFQSMRNYRHHGNMDCLSHSLRVADMAFSFAVRFNVDVVTTLRGALLHDFYLYDWHEPKHSLHGYRHPYEALRKAEKRFELNFIERDIIKKHMFPLTLMPPLYRESWIVCIADKISAVEDYIYLMSNRSFAGKLRSS